MPKMKTHRGAAKRFKASWVEMGALLVRIRREQSYKQWDHPTFETYCARELFIKPATAQKLTRGYAFLEKHERELMSQPLDGVALAPGVEHRGLPRQGLEEALVDAGIHRLRPVLVTVGATVFALFPLALHGGPFWEPLCYAQIGGLTFATVGTLWLVPVLYATAVDLKLVTWNKPNQPA